jgi:radical SAM-linked protein
LKKRKVGRNQIIDALAGLTSVFAPNNVNRMLDPISGRMVVSTDTGPLAKRAVVGTLGDHPPGLGPVPAVKAVFDRYSVEVARGCTAGCRFCQASFLYRPVRERTVKEVEDAVERSVACLGFDSVSLAALSTADHSCIGSLISNLGEEYTPRRVSLTVPSLRAYGLADEVVEVLGRLRATGVTLAPEAGSQRMRDAINKNVTEEDLHQAAARFFDRGFAKIKLYFMIGLPDETDEDLEEIVNLAERLRDLGRKRLRGRHPNITISVSTFIPKPFTPFQREPMIGMDEIRRRQHIVKTLGKQKRLEVRVHDTRLSVLEGILCRGDSRLAPMLEKAMELGARFDGWDDMYKDAVWQETLSQFDTAPYLDGIPEEGRLPWDHVDALVDPVFLNNERELARNAKATEPCGRFAKTNEQKAVVVCHGCGLKCPPDTLPLRQPRPETTGNYGPVRQPSAKPRPQTVSQEGVEDAVRLRLFLAKWGRQVFIGHLDTMRHVMHGLRRAGITLVYTQGFHPKPKISAAPPLPLGTVGLKEPIDIHVLVPSDEDELLTRLRGAFPEEMEIVAVEKIPPGRRSLSKLIQDAKYVALVTVDVESAQLAIKNLLAATSCEIERTRKGRTKKIDIRPYLVDAEVCSEISDSLRLPKTQNRVAVAFTLALPPSGGVRATEVLSAAFGKAASDAWVVRTEFVIES